MKIRDEQHRISLDNKIMVNRLCTLFKVNFIDFVEWISILNSQVAGPGQRCSGSENFASLRLQVVETGYTGIE